MNKMREKVIVLYMLDAVDGSLSTAQISEFMLQRQDVDYFAFQEMMEELKDAGLVYTEQSYQRTLFTLTGAGREALSFYQTQVPVPLEEEILTYLEDHEIEIREQLTVYSDLYKSTDGKYAAVCQLRQDERKVVDLSLSVDTRAQAKAVCRQWREHYQEIYETLMDTLVK